MALVTAWRNIAEDSRRIVLDRHRHHGAYPIMGAVVVERASALAACADQLAKELDQWKPLEAGE